MEIFDVRHLKKTYFSMSLPVVMGLIVTLIYNLADTYFITATKDDLLIAGVSLCSPLFTALMAFGNIYGRGGGRIRFGVYACSPEESSFTAVFTDMQVTECMWQAHDGQKPDWE